MVTMLVNTISLVYWQRSYTNKEKLQKEEKERKRKEQEEEEQLAHKEHENEEKKKIYNLTMRIRTEELKRYNTEQTEIFDNLFETDIDKLCELCAWEKRTNRVYMHDSFRYNGYTGDKLKEDIIQEIYNSFNRSPVYHKYRVETSVGWLVVSVKFGLSENYKLYAEKMFPVLQK